MSAESRLRLAMRHVRPNGDFEEVAKFTDGQAYEPTQTKQTSGFCKLPAIPVGYTPVLVGEWLVKDEDGNITTEKHVAEGYVKIYK